METINIVMATDENYVVPTMVTISSLLASSKREVHFHVYILYAQNLKGASKNLLKELEKTDGRLRLTFKEVCDSKLDAALTTAHISTASYYRLYISRVIEEERCLYVDGDMIVKDDLSEIYHADLEQYYAAAVKDLGIQCNMPEHKGYVGYLGIPSMDNYVNAGFLLLNLKKIRKDHVGQRMIEAISEGYKYMDQDIINKYFYGKIKILPLKYNFFTEYYGSVESESQTGYSPEELCNIERNAIVLHFTGYFKPWVCTRLKVNALWWDEAKRVLDKELYQKVLKSAKEAERKSDWQYVFQAAQGAKQIVIFGFSCIGKKVADRLLCSNVKSVVAFADNDRAKEGSVYEGISVISADNAVSDYPDALYIISSQNGFIPIQKQLNEMGVDNCRVIRYIHKDRTYYARLGAQSEKERNIT